MGKSGKKQKDFQKVKLRVGKKLPKGLNVTDTSFKSKRIVIVDKLQRPTSGEATTSRKLTIQDLVSRLHHYNATARLDALKGIKELGTSHPEVLTPHLKSLLETLGPICSDRECLVRQAAHKVLKLILSSVTSDRLSPFGPLLLSQLGCAVNHLSADVRNDALDLLSIMLGCVPSLIISAPYTVLLNFLHMISTCKETSGGSPSAKRRRVLSTQLSRRQTSVAWWAQVLGRLERFLTVAVEAWFPDGSKLGAGVEKEGPVVRIKGRSGGVTLYKTGLEPRAADGLSLYAGLLSTGGTTRGCKESGREFSMELVHLLLDMWTEADPSSSGGASLSWEALALMNSILKVLLLVIDWLKKENVTNMRWFEETFGSSLVSHFAPRFPYSPDCLAGAVMNKQKRKFPFSREVSVTSLNLSTCEVLASLLGAVPPAQCSRMLRFLRDLLRTEGHVRPGDVKAVLKVARLLLPHVSAKERLSVVESVWNVFDSNENLQKKECYLILNFFYDLLLDLRRAAEPLPPVLNAFLRSLPERTLGLVSTEDADMRVLHFLCKVALLQLPPFTESLKDCSELYIDLLQTLTDDSHQRTVIGLLCRIPDLCDEHFVRLFDAVPCLTTDSLLYLLQLLLARFQESNSDPEYVATYCSFLLSVSTGMSHSKAVDLENAWMEKSSWPSLKELQPELSTIYVVPQDVADVASHAPVVDVALVSLALFPAECDLEWVLAPFLDQFFKMYRFVSCTAAVSLLRIVGRKAPTTHEKSGEVLLGMAASLLCILAGVKSSEKEDRSHDAILNAVVDYVTNCSCVEELLSLLLQVLQVPLSSASLRLLACSAQSLLQQGLLGVDDKAAVLDVLTALKMQGDLQYQPWYHTIVYNFALEVPKAGVS